MEDFSGLIKIEPALFEPNIKNLKKYIDDVNANRASKSRNKLAKQHHNAIDFFRQYEWSRIPWYAKIPVFFFGNAYRDYNHATNFHDFRPWHGYGREIFDIGFEMSKKRFSKYQESFIQARTRIHATDWGDETWRFSSIMSKINEDHPNPGFEEAPYPIIIESIKNCIANCENEMYVSLENYNLLMRHG